MIEAHTDQSAGQRRLPWRLIGWSVAALLLAVPLGAMQVSDEVSWEISDFVFAGTLIGGAGLAFELAVRKTASRSYRIAAAIALLSAVLLIWVNVAVGLIGSEDDPANAMYGDVLLIAFVGAIVSKLEASGLKRTMLVTAAAQIVVATIALVQGLGATEPPGTFGILAANTVFAGLWILSAVLFDRASRSAISD